MRAVLHNRGCESICFLKKIEIDVVLFPYRTASLLPGHRDRDRDSAPVPWALILPHISGLQPLDKYAYKNPGRWPGLVWPRTFGAA